MSHHLKAKRRLIRTRQVERPEHLALSKAVDQIQKALAEPVGCKSMRPSSGAYHQWDSHARPRTSSVLSCGRIGATLRASRKFTGVQHVRRRQYRHIACLAGRARAVVAVVAAVAARAPLPRGPQDTLLIHWPVESQLHTQYIQIIHAPTSDSRARHSSCTSAVINVPVQLSSSRMSGE